LLDVGSGNDLSGKVKPLAEVVETLGGQGVVVVLPRELSLDIAARVERLKSLDNEQVLGVDIGVLGKVEVLLGDEDTLTEEVLAGKRLVMCAIAIVSVQLAIRRHRCCAARKYWLLPRGSSCGRPWESTSWRYLLLVGRVDVGRWQFSEGRRQGLKMSTFVGENPTKKWEVAKWGGESATLWLSSRDEEMWLLVWLLRDPLIVRLSAICICA
jgi:hypothetical protein